jgi:hypothetical protein
MLQILITLFAGSGSLFYFDADPDLTFHIDADHASILSLHIS